MNRLLGGSVFAVSLLVAGSASATWSLSTVVSGNSVGTRLAIAREVTNGLETLHITYERIDPQVNTTGCVYNSKFASNAWASPWQYAYGHRPHIAMGDGGPVMSHWNHLLEAIRYVPLGGDPSFIETNVDGTDENAVAAGAVAFVDGGGLLVAYEDDNFDVFSIGNGYIHPSMASYSNGATAIGFSKSKTAYYFAGNETFYTFESVGTTLNNVSYTDTQVDTSQRVWMLFNNEFRWRSTGGAWSGGQFTTQSVPHGASLAITPNGSGGQVVAAAFGNSNGLYVTHVNGPWGPVTYYVDAPGAVGDVDIVAAGPNRFALIYRDEAHDAIKLAVGTF